MTHTDQSRAEFEKWASKDDYNTKTDGQTYYFHDTHYAWLGWQAALNYAIASNPAETASAEAGLRDCGTPTTEQSSGVELPEPQCEIEVRSHATYVEHPIYEWRDNLPDGTYKLYTEQQVRTLLAGVKDSLIAAPAVPQGWMPIKSAPKDGSEILLTSRKGRVANGCWMTANNRCGAWLWAYIKQEPTHWMPLPQSPKEQT